MTTPPNPLPKKVTPSPNILENMISIPVSKPLWLNQCGQWSVVYPPYHTSIDEKVTEE